MLIGLAKNALKNSYRVGELEGFFLIQLEILVRSYGVYRSILEPMQQLQILHPKLIDCGTTP